MGMEQYPERQAAGEVVVAVAGHHHHWLEGLSVEHCNEFNEVPGDVSDVLTGEWSTRLGNPDQDHSSSGG